MIIPLDEEGIAAYTQTMWDSGFLRPYGLKEEWASYEEFHTFVSQVWDIRKEETRKRL